MNSDAQSNVKPSSLLDAGSIEFLPVEGRLVDQPRASIERLQLIRDAAERAIREKQSTVPPRLSIGVRQASFRIVRANPVEERLRQINAAITFLQGRGTLITVVDRDALIRQYRVAGRREHCLGEELIDLARHFGMEG